MIKKKTKFLFALLMCTMCLTALAPHVKASEITSGEIPVTIDLGDSFEESVQKFEIELKAEDLNNPMPEGSIDGVYTIYITGADTTKLPKISYSKEGEYRYTISQKIEKDAVGEYDTNIYLLEVEVGRSSQNGRLQALSTMSVFGYPHKVAGAVFYNAPPPPSPKPTEGPDETPKPTEKPDGTPKTSDESVILPYILMFISGAGMIAFITLDNRKKLRTTSN